MLLNAATEIIANLPLMPLSATSPSSLLSLLLLLLLLLNCCCCSRVHACGRAVCMMLCMSVRLE